MPSIIVPAIRLIILLFLVRKLIIASVAAEEIAAKTNRGKPIPMPKNRKRSTFSRKPVADMALVKRAAINSGLQGTTMAPKKKPNKKALAQGFLAIGVRALGRNLPTSTLKISKRLMTSNIPKAMGDTMPIILVNDTSRMVVKINPSSSINRMTPEVMTSPNKVIVALPGSLSAS